MEMDSAPPELGTDDFGLSTVDLSDDQTVQQCARPCSHVLHAKTNSFSFFTISTGLIDFHP
jgi:hypothetical protein